MCPIDYRISIERDWDWAPEYVEAIWLMLQQDKAYDYFIPTLASHTLEEFVEPSFSTWHDHVVIAPALFQPTGLSAGKGEPAKAHEKLRWRAQHGMKDVVRMISEKGMIAFNTRNGHHYPI